MKREINPVRGKKRFNLDVVGRLQVYFPVFFELLSDNRVNWKTVEKVLAGKIEKWKSKADGGTIQVEASFYNIITASIEGDTRAADHLDFIRKLFEELIRCLDIEERKLVVPALFGLLSNIDNKFWNFIGELLVLNNFKKMMQLRLTAVEVPVLATKPDGPRIDFQFFDRQKQSTLLIEVVNVHVHGCGGWTDEQIDYIVRQKIDHKLNKTGIKSSRDFWLVPVFWGSYVDLMRVHSYYQSEDIHFQNTLEPTGFVSFTDTVSRQHINVFGNLSDIHDRYDLKVYRNRAT